MFQEDHVEEEGAFYIAAWRWDSAPYVYEMNRKRSLTCREYLLLFNARSLLRGKIWGLLKEMRALCVSSSVSSKCDPAGFLKQLVALGPVS